MLTVPRSLEKMEMEMEKREGTKLRDDGTESFKDSSSLDADSDEAEAAAEAEAEDKEVENEDEDEDDDEDHHSDDDGEGEGTEHMEASLAENKYNFQGHVEVFIFSSVASFTKALPTP